MPRRLEVAVELPFHRRHVDDVLVALRRAQHQRLEARVDDERRDRVHELHLEQLHRRHLGHQQPPGVAAAQIDLLQILIEPALGEQIASAPRRSSGSSGTCDSSAACVRPATSAMRRSSAPAQRALAFGQHVVAAQPFVAPSSLRTCAGMSWSAARLALHHVLVEIGRTPDGLARVVDDEVEPVARGEQLVAERLDARRVAQIESEDLEPIAPLAESRAPARSAPPSRAESAS